MRKFLCTGLILIFAFVFMGGCGWVGRTAGKAQAKIERKADSVEEGYREGYEQERSKTAPAGK
jgi:hypothetical protein